MRLGVVRCLVRMTADLSALGSSRNYRRRRSVMEKESSESHPLGYGEGKGGGSGRGGD